MKKSEYKAVVRRQREGDTPKGGWSKFLSTWELPAGSKLSRKAAEGKL